MVGEVAYRWSGQVRNALDGLALIGPDLVDEQVFVITGDTGLGMTHGTLGGIILSDMIGRRMNPWAELYSPARLPLKAAGELLREGIDTVAQLGDLLSGGDLPTEERIPPDSGAVVGWGLGKAAVYRDAQGVISRRSAVCPHAGCIVAWNDIEKSWDCPCHGSRYDAHGRVFSGPARADLGPVD
jgi:nitrite reductase/ring-hydroxylating ferredoxin subunit